VVKTIGEFTPGTQKKAGGARFRTMTFKDDGQTDDPMSIWSRDVLMDLTRYEALKMVVKKIGGDDYLFIEAGGFSTRNPVGGQSPWYVMKQVSQ